MQIDDGARGNLIGLVTMATLVAQGVTVWPEGYSRGWVTAEGPRIPLPTPEGGVQLALAASASYSGLVQHVQDLVDAVTAAEDPCGVRRGRSQRGMATDLVAGIRLDGRGRVIIARWVGGAGERLVALSFGVGPVV